MFSDRNKLIEINKDNRKNSKLLDSTITLLNNLWVKESEKEIHT